MRVTLDLILSEIIIHVIMVTLWWIAIVQIRVTMNILTLPGIIRSSGRGKRESEGLRLTITPH